MTLPVMDRCGHQHLTWEDRARCLWPDAYRIRGDGPFASIAYCDVLTVELHRTAANARAARAFIDRCGCGHACERDHEVVEMTP